MSAHHHVPVPAAVSPSWRERRRRRLRRAAVLAARRQDAVPRSAPGADA